MLTKYAYTGEVWMDETRVKEFVEAAKSLQMIGLMNQNENFEIKDKKKKKRNQPTRKRVHEDSDSNLSDATTVYTPDTLKRMKLEKVTTEVIIESNKDAPVTFVNRKRRQSHDDSDDTFLPGKVMRTDEPEFHLNTAMSSIGNMRIRKPSISECSDISIGSDY